MIPWWRNWPELRGLDPDRQRAAWEAGFGAVSARPVHLAALACQAVCTAGGAVGGGLLWRGPAGWLVGAVVGAVLGAFVYAGVMHRAVRPHLLRYLRMGQE